MSTTEVGAPPTFERRSVVYCGVCTLPVEYCEFNKHRDGCLKWLQQNHPDLFVKMYPDQVAEESAEGVSKLSVDDKKAADKEQAPKPDTQKKKKKGATVTNIIVRRLERGRRKRVIVIQGLDQFDIDQKKLAKVFASKYATGSSVTKSNIGKDEISIQGDVAADVEAYLNTLVKEKGFGVAVQVVEGKG